MLSGRGRFQTCPYAACNIPSLLKIFKKPKSLRFSYLYCYVACQVFMLESYYRILLLIRCGNGKCCLTIHIRICLCFHEFHRAERRLYHKLTLFVY